VRYAQIILIALVFMMLVPTAYAEPTIGEIDNYSKTSHGEPIEYNWTFYNPDNYTYRVEVYYDIPLGWSTEASDRSFDLAPGETHSFTLTMTPSEYAVSGNYSVSFREIPYENPNFTEMVVMNGHSTVILTVPRSMSPFEVILNDMAGIQIENVWVAFVLNIIFWAALGAAIFLIFDPILTALAKKTETEIDDMILGILKGPVFAYMIAWGVVSSIYIFETSTVVVLWTDRIYHIFLIIIIAWVSYKIFRDVVITWARKYASKTDNKLDDALIPLTEKLGIIIIGTGAIAYILQYLGFNLTMMIAGLGMIGLVIAFAAQDTLSNFFSGIHLLLDRPFKEGDIIALSTGEYCEVKHVGMRSTKLYNTFDHDMIIIPNSDIASQKIVNVSTPDPYFKLRFTMDVSYNADVDMVKKTILDNAMKHPNVIKSEDRKPFVRLVDFLDSNIRFKLYLWVDDAMNQWKVEADIKEWLFKEFKDKGIEISYPTHVVYLEKE
jgi:MscS family membrane protein